MFVSVVLEIFIDNLKSPVIHFMLRFKNTHREKHRQIKLQRLPKVQIWAFGLLVQQNNSL